MDNAKIQKIMGYFENVYCNTKENSEAINKLPDAYGLPKLNQEGINILNKPRSASAIEKVLKTLPKKRSLSPNGFTAKF